MTDQTDPFDQPIAGLTLDERLSALEHLMGFVIMKAWDEPTALVEAMQVFASKPPPTENEALQASLQRVFLQMARLATMGRELREIADTSASTTQGTRA